MAGQKDLLIERIDKKQRILQDGAGNLYKYHIYKMFLAKRNIYGILTIVGIFTYSII